MMGDDHELTREIAVKLSKARGVSSADVKDIQMSLAEFKVILQDDKKDGAGRDRTKARNRRNPGAPGAEASAKREASI